MISVIELFAGCGGMALGLERAGLNCILLNDNDRNACQTLSFNHPEWNVICNNIAEIDFSQSKADVVTGGFPCQAFSYAGAKGGFDDVRGTLFFEFARAIRAIKPLIFVAENVKGLLTHDNGKTLQTITHLLRTLGYTVTTKLLNAMHYNVPQKRERLFIVGIKDGANLSFNYPIPSKNIITLRDGLAGVPPSSGMSYSTKKREIMKRVPPGGCWRDLPLVLKSYYMGKSIHASGGKTGMARRLSWDEPCLTLTCNPAQKQTERCHPDETRPLTIREYARIQTFPDDWQFVGSMASQYKQIGNAVPVNLAEAMGRAIFIAFAVREQRTRR